MRDDRILNVVRWVKEIASEREVARHVERRVEEFRTLGREGKVVFDFRPYLDIEVEADVFSELCFCILTANSSAELGIRIQKEVGIEGFRSMSEEELARVFERMGHRYARVRAKWIVMARHFDLSVVMNQSSPHVARQIVMGVKGLGLKESSHFLRNVGFDGVAIVDRHIFRFLVSHGLLPPAKSITPKIYERAEKVLKRISELSGVPLPALDLFIFWRQTGRVLK